MLFYLNDLPLMLNRTERDCKSVFSRENRFKSGKMHAMKPTLSSYPYTPPAMPQPMPLGQAWALLGGMSPEVFMRDYWQKKPLLIRGAIPAFALAKKSGQALTSPIDFAQLCTLAQSDQVESRLVKAHPWSLEKGPLKQIPALHEKEWTLLVQGMNLHHEAAQTVLSWFRFIPDARLDDLMISVAGPGGGVGPHVDSYDVFLLQMSGRRRWKISAQKNLDFCAGLPLKILKDFKASSDWILEPGDMLYLPPHIAHDGIALDPGCQTWSIGFRSPSYAELISEILWRTADVLAEDPALASLYTDPLQKAVAGSGRIPQAMVKAIAKRLDQLRWSNSDISCSLAAMLSEPKPHVVFEPPQPVLSLSAFHKAALKHGLRLAWASRLLHDGEFIYLNGESVSDNHAPDWSTWLALSHLQRLTGAQMAEAQAVLEDENNPWYEHYLAGALILNKT